MSEGVHVKALKTIALLLPLTLMLGGCDQVLEMANKQKANGKAIGAACRHSGRSLEDCYQRNSRIAKADIFAGWKEMNEYMQSKKIDVVPPPPDLKTGTLSPAEMSGEGLSDLSVAASSAASATSAAPKKH
ncbi:hypothetical protein HQ393_09040 [Chitinibacter bivalviorum]|uniref:Uncharacterized protein n=1 Tax=Chitinibacter bivalviorum TaxID=2739434 RepID=A0A7H9BI34_9NEIS|nr:hypothetical protein [Chitinibacter bivalviorum]QLG88380.1 hypothetical protein HQ393_09040 [Chitinibacter bivalviorum]